MSFQDEFRSGLSEMQSSAGSTASIAGLITPVIDDGVNVEQIFDTQGGYSMGRVLNLTIVRTENTADPVIGGAVVFQGKKYTINSYGSDDVSFTLKCIEDRRR
jgi:hypothetical protein